MPDLWMDVDIALAEVPVNLLPLIDDGDFKAIEDAVLYNAAGMSLVWNFITTGGAFTSTAVVPTTSGVHDWNEHTADKGMYTLEIPASGGTVDNDTEGFGWFSGVATGVLPWRGPVIGFRDAAINNLLIDDALTATQGLAGTFLDASVAGIPTTMRGTDNAALATEVALLVTALVNKMIITELTGTVEQHDSAGTSLGTIATCFTSDGTYTTRKRLVI